MTLYVPGYGVVTNEELAVRQACREEDPDLVFKRSARNNHYTIFQRLMRDSVYVKQWEAADLEDGDLFPIVSFQHRIPSVDEVKKWLYEHDQYRGDLLEKVQRHNAKRRKELDDWDYEQRHERAVFLEHGMRMLGTDTGRSVSTPNTGKRRRTFG